MPELTQSQIEQARKRNLCPKCKQPGNRAKTSTGLPGHFLMKCLNFGCGGQWKEDSKGEIIKD